MIYEWSMFDFDTEVKFPWVPDRTILLELITGGHESWPMNGIGFYHVELDPGIPRGDPLVGRVFYDYLRAAIDLRSDAYASLEHI